MMLTLRKGSAAAHIDPSAMVKQSELGQGSVIGRDCVVLSSSVGANCDIESRNLLNNAVIGNMTYTGADVSITWAQVGKYCCIARLVDIGGNEHNYRAASMMPSYRLMNRLAGKLQRHHDEEHILVGNDVWIGSGATIARKDGLMVGDGAVIGAGAVVTKSVPPYAVVAGVPARVIKYRFDDDVIARLLKLAWWNWPDDQVLAAWPLLSQDLTMDVLDQLDTMTLEYGGVDNECQ